MPSKSVACIALLALLPVFAQAQIIDDKMMPPILVAPPASDQPVESAPGFEPNITETYDDTEPLSVFEVPLLDVPAQEDGVADDKPRLIGTFSLLHKVTAKVRQINLPAGEEVTIGDLTLVMHDCISTPPEEAPETKAFLQVFEFKTGTDRKLFSGWMFASSPGLHALEHPVFDLWAMSCQTEDGLAYTGEISSPRGPTRN